MAQQLSEAQKKAAQLQGTFAQNAPRPTASPAAASMPGMAAPAAPASPIRGMGDDKMMGMMGQMMGEEITTKIASLALQWPRDG